MNAEQYLQEVRARGEMLRAVNPSGTGNVVALGATISAGDFLGSGHKLSDLASTFQLTLNPVPNGLSAADKQTVLVADMMTWQSRAQAVVVEAEANAGLVPGQSTATDRILANTRVEDSISGALSSIYQYAGSVLPEAIAPKVASKDLALSLRRQYNSAVAGTLAHTPQGVGMLLTYGATADDIQRDYLHRMMTYQAIVKLGEQKSTSKLSGLGVLFLLVPVVVLAVVSVIAIIAAALVANNYITQRNAIWSDVMKKCADQASSSEFCKSAIEEFAAEPPWNILSTLLNSKWALLGGAAVLFVLMTRRKS